jgi:hypothetical protein
MNFRAGLNLAMMKITSLTEVTPSFLAHSQFAFLNLSRSYAKAGKKKSEHVFHLQYHVAADMAHASVQLILAYTHFLV